MIYIAIIVSFKNAGVWRKLLDKFNRNLRVNYDNLL